MNYELEFHQLLNVMAANSRVQLTQTMLKIYDKAVEPFGYERACKALEKLMLETKVWQMPTPKALIDSIDSRPSRIAEANEVAGRIIQSVSKFGWSSPEQARQYIGELGWSVVQRFGGWGYLCEGLGMSIDVSSTRAQMRDSALSIMEISEHRSINEPPSLEYTPNKQLESTVKLLASAKGMPK